MKKQTPGLLEMIAQLIGTPSVSSVNPAIDMGNMNVINLLASWLEDLGFRIDVMPVGDDGRKGNLIATLGTGIRGLVLSGHTDTVPYDEGQWQHDPFKLTERNQRLYGLGTSDMKSFLALAIEASTAFNANQLKQPLIILATADEESSMSGARALTAQDIPRAQHAVIGEPTGMRPVRMHKGIFMESIKLIGHSGHSSNPALGNNALEAMHHVIGDLLDWRNKLQEQHKNPLFVVPVPTMNLGHIHGGDNPNRICSDCELQIDFRPLPGMDINELRNELHERVEHTLEDTGIRTEFRSLFDGIPAMDTPAEREIIRITEKLTGHAAETADFGTEGPYLTELGMDTVIMGPGDIDQAHQPDEFIEAARLQPTVELLRNLVKSVCM
jgi:acetylornithine deacetylase